MVNSVFSSDSKTLLFSERSRISKALWGSRPKGGSLNRVRGGHFLGSKIPLVFLRGFLRGFLRFGRLIAPSIFELLKKFELLLKDLSRGIKKWPYFPPSLNFRRSYDPHESQKKWYFGVEKYP